LSLQGENIRIRAMKSSDLERMYELMSSPESWGDFEPFSAQDWFSFEKHMRERGSNPASAALFVMERNQDKSIVGIIFHRESHPILKNTEIGYAVLDPESRGKGVASEAANLIVDYLFKNKTIQRIEAVTDVENVASQKVLEKCGFKREGTMRKARWVNGTFHDYYMYGILREEWRNPGHERPKSARYLES
jgi:RimJ/RimL family protein N-acetyltransferase